MGMLSLESSWLTLVCWGHCWLCRKLSCCQLKTRHKYSTFCQMCLAMFRRSMSCFRCSIAVNVFFLNLKCLLCTIVKPFFAVIWFVGSGIIKSVWKKAGFWDKSCKHNISLSFYFAFAIQQIQRSHYVFGPSFCPVCPIVCFSSIRPNRYCYHDISWTAWTVLIKHTGNTH